MRKSFFRHTASALAVLSLMVLLSSQAPCIEKKGTITVKNETSETFYIVIDDYSQGEVWPNYSESYKVTYGEHRVEAAYGDNTLVKYIKVSDTYPTETWTITESSL